MKSLDDLGDATRHRLDSRPAIAGVSECLDVRADGCSDLLPRHVGRRQRSADDACVDEHDVDAELANPIGEVGVLLAFRVERSDEHNGGHGRLPFSSVIELVYHTVARTTLTGRVVARREWLDAEVAALCFGIVRQARPPSSPRQCARQP